MSRRLTRFAPRLSFFALGMALAFASCGVRAQSGPTPQTPVKHDTLANRLVVGFQGWFMCPQDAGSDHKWGHWFTYRPPSDDNNVTPARFHADLAPDTSELSPEERCPTAFTTKDGHPFVLFSDQNPKTVLRQFQWMAEYKIDVAALQRFIVGIAPGRPAALRQGLDTVLHNALDAADATGRGFYVMYDIAGAAPNEWGHILVGDWKKLLAEGVTKHSSYQFHHGRPVLAIAGPGLEGRRGAAQETLEVVRQLREASEPYGGVTLIITGGSDWRTLNGDVQSGPEWAQVYRSFDIINPWTVGRYKDEETVPIRLTPTAPRCRMRPRAERSGRNMARQSRQANARDQDRQHMPRHTEKAHETLGLTGETQIVALADFHGRFDNHHQPWWVWALTGQARKKPSTSSSSSESVPTWPRQSAIRSSSCRSFIREPRTAT